MKELDRRFRAQHALVSRADARACGMSDDQIGTRVATQEWLRVWPGVYRSAAAPVTPEQTTLAACLACGPTAVASHASAAWLWNLVDRPPPRPEVTVLRPANPRCSGVIVHRSADLDLSRISTRRGVPCTNPLRTVVDLAGGAPAAVTRGAVDRGLASKLFTLEALTAEMQRLARPGRRGTRPLRADLVARGMVAGPHPSVLESETLRLLRRHLIEPLGCEVTQAAAGSRYRLDVALTPRAAMEVDGFAYHASPEAKAHDEQRRNALRLGGLFVLVYTWRHIRFDGRRVIGEVRRAIRDHP